MIDPSPLIYGPASPLPYSGQGVDLGNAFSAQLIGSYADRIVGDVTRNWQQVVPFLLVYIMVKLLSYLLDLRAKRSVPTQLELF